MFHSFKFQLKFSSSFFSEIAFTRPKNLKTHTPGCNCSLKERALSQLPWSLTRWRNTVPLPVKNDLGTSASVLSASQQQWASSNKSCELLQALPGYQRSRFPTFRHCLYTSKSLLPVLEGRRASNHIQALLLRL